MSTSRINARAQLTTTSFAVALGGLVAGLTCTSQLAAQTSDAIAESLYQDAKSNFQAGDYEHACPKLAQSYKVDPAGGTVLLLAICYEKQGKLASAWARYNEALAIAKRDGRDDRERRAQDGLESVKPKLSYIKLTFDPVTQGIPGIVLMIDGTELPAISDTPLAVDTGTHHLAIRAPQYETWQVDVAVADQGQTQDVSVPQPRLNHRSLQ
jgi:tetratricopeptide (TPR) repeat protein